MAREDITPAAQGAHALRMDDRASVEATGVTQVLAFDEQQVTLMTGAGELTILGEDLHVTHLLLDDGRMTIAGRVDVVQYRDARAPRQGLFRRAFK